MKQHISPPSALALFPLGLRPAVKVKLLPLDLQRVPATEVVKHLLTALACKAFQVESRPALLVNRDRDGFLSHRDLPPHGKLKPHLFAF